MIETAERRLDDKAQLSVIKSGKVPLLDNSIDVVISNLVFMMVPTKDELKRVFYEVNRVLVNRGTFAFSITHPAFAGEKFTTYYNRFPEPLDYFKSGQPYQFVLIGRNGIEITNEHFRDYHYPLETYFNLLCDSGFALQQVREVKVEGNRYPPYLIFKTSKF
jgi:SAM-dependent methyltransferase